MNYSGNSSCNEYTYHLIAYTYETTVNYSGGCSHYEHTSRNICKIVNLIFKCNFCESILLAPLIHTYTVCEYDCCTILLDSVRSTLTHPNSHFTNPFRGCTYNLYLISTTTSNRVWFMRLYKGFEVVYN